MKKIVLLIVLLLLIPNAGEAAPLDNVPGCATYPDGWIYTVNGWKPSSHVWCGSDALGWYNPMDWCTVSGYCYRDYGITDE